MKAFEIPVNYVINDTYRIICPIGSGGTGIIYLAEHMNLQKKVVLKRIKSRYKTSRTVRQEADILKSLHHMYLPQVYDFIVYDNDIFTVIDFIDGSDMDKYISSYTAVTEERLVKWMYQMCDALTYIHTRKPAVFHNDIKPANIIINENDDICLIDFNISSDDNEAVLGFTPAYASPEQYFRVLSIKRSEELYGRLAPVFSGFTGIIDGRSDLYSLGATFYAMASRIQPNVKNAVYGNHMPLTPEMCGLSEGFCRIINKLMNLRPEDRYSSAEEVRKALVRLKKQNSGYRKYLLLKTAAIMTSGIMVIAGILLIFYGVRFERGREFRKRFYEMTTAYEMHNYWQSESIGMELIEDNEKNNILSYADLGKVYYYTAMSCYSVNNLLDASQYIEDAIKCTEHYDSVDDQKVYEMNASVIYAYLGSVEGAWSHADNARVCGLDADNYNMLFFQMYYAQNDFEMAFGYFYNINPQNLDMVGQMKLYEIAGDMYYQTSETAKAIEMFEKAYSIGGSTEAARRIGEIYFLQSREGGTKEYRLECLHKSANYYAAAAESEYCSTSDFVNLSKIYRNIAEYTDSDSNYKNAENVLLNGLNKFPDSVFICEQLAITYYYMGDNDNALTYCNKVLDVENRLVYYTDDLDKYSADDRNLVEEIRKRIEGERK